MCLRLAIRYRPQFEDVEAVFHDEIQRPQGARPARQGSMRACHDARAQAPKRAALRQQ